MLDPPKHSLINFWQNSDLFKKKYRLRFATKNVLDGGGGHSPHNGQLCDAKVCLKGSLKITFWDREKRRVTKSKPNV